MLKRIINARRLIQLAIGLAVYVVVAAFDVSLWWVVGIGSALGILLGKFFCRWMCPMGYIMELMLGAGGEQNAQSNMYMYFKVGCPIAWVGGLLNRLSLFRVKLREDQCLHCGKCDTACYISSFNADRSLHEPGQRNASAHYSCSRCFKCVTACPTGALTLGPGAANLLPTPATDEPDGAAATRNQRKRQRRKAHQGG